MSKRRRYLSESESESEPAAEEANGGESEEADEPYSTIWRAAGPLTMRQDMQHDSQVLYSLRARGSREADQAGRHGSYDWEEVRTCFHGGGSYGPGGGRLGDVLARHRVSVGPGGPTGDS